MSLYEDKAKGILTEQLEQEQNDGKERVQNIMAELSLADDMGKDYGYSLMKSDNMPLSQSLTR